MAFNPLYSTGVVGGNFFPIAYSVRLTDQTVYNSLIPFGFYGPFGTPVIGGVSPNDMAAYCGVPVVHNGSYAAQISVPDVVVIDTAVVPGGPFAPLDQGSGTYAGQNWLWMASVELYINGTLPAAPVVHLASGVYTGNGGSQSINVGFDLTPANSGVMICASGGGSAGGFRTDLMAGTAPLNGGSSGSGVANAVSGLTGSGFNVGTGGNLVNVNAQQYVWFAFSNPDGTYLKTGHYVGSGATDSSGSSGLVNGTNQQTIAGAGAGDVGNTVDVYTLAGVYVSSFSIVAFNAGVCTISPVWVFNTATYTTVIHRSPLTVSVPFAVPATPTDIWIFGIGGSCPAIYKGGSFSPGQSVYLAGHNFNSKINILATSPNAFKVGSGLSNTAGQDRYFLALTTAGASPISNFYQDGVSTGVNNSYTVSGLSFTPSFAISQQIIDSTVVNGIWRAVGVQGGTDSSGFSTDSGSGNVTDFPNGGITSLTADGFVAGSSAVSTGNPAGWYAFKTGTGTNTGGPLTCNCPGNSTPGFIGTGYQIQLTASGGTAPYRFELVNGSLPNGLVLDPNTGVITGVPSQTGVFLFSYRVIGGNLVNSNDVTIASCSITITTPNTNNPTLPSVPPSSGSPTNGCINTQSPGADSGGVAGCISTM